MLFQYQKNWGQKILPYFLLKWGWMKWDWLLVWHYSFSMEKTFVYCEMRLILDNLDLVSIKLFLCFVQPLSCLGVKRPPTANPTTYSTQLERNSGQKHFRNQIYWYSLKELTRFKYRSLKIGSVSYDFIVNRYGKYSA